MKYASIIMVHYSLADDFGETRMGFRASPARIASLKKSGFDMKDYTRSNLLKWTLESLIKNTVYPYELIVIDNGGKPDDTDYLLGLLREGKITTLIRNRDNMCFGYGRNQGLGMATGDYVCIIDNDISFEKNWLKTCVELLEKYPDKKLISSPYITPDKLQQRYILPNLDGNRVNSSCGSNCMVMTRKTMDDIGEFQYGEIAGTFWHRNMSKLGYSVIVPPKDMVIHTGCMGGFNYKKRMKVFKTLSDNTKIMLYE